MSSNINLSVVGALCLAGSLGTTAVACDLCAIYSASNARGESTSGFVFTATEQFIPFRTVQLNSKPVPGGSYLDNDYVDSSMSHFVVGYNFTPRFGLSFSVPYIHRDYHRFEQRQTLTTGSVFQTVEGTEAGLGDVALVGRLTVFQRNEMTHAIIVNLLAGVKFPTGDTSQLKDLVEQERIFDTLFGPGHQHFLSGVHQSDLTLGSGSFDGIFGITGNFRWQRWFFNAQCQYYLRTEGESSYQFGDQLILAGGPGAYILLRDTCTLNLQANAFFEMAGRDSLLGRKFNNTGMTATYVGPQITFTWGEHFSAQAAVDLPARIENNGLMNVPDYRIHGGLTWRF